MSIDRTASGNGTPARQVITLAYLSKHLPAALISEQLAQSLCAETGDTVVLVRPQLCEGPPAYNGAQYGDATVVDWAPSELVFQGQFGAPANLRKTDAGFHLLTLSVRKEPGPAQSIATVVGQLTRHFCYVLVEALAEETPDPSLLELWLRSDLTYLFHQAATEDIYRLDLVMREIRKRPGADGKRIKPILCLTDGESINGFDALAQRVAAPAHLFIHGCPKLAGANPDATPIAAAGSFLPDIRRLAREVSGRLVGLALSSGAAKGFAHIGVIQVLEENRIEVDVIAGASIGAYIGALWAHGHDGTKLERLARELEGRWALWTLIDPVFPPRQGFLRGLALKRRLQRSIGNAHFADLIRPLRIVAGNLATLERTVFSSGEVATAVHASMAVPGLCVPVSIDGEPYIDGGIVDPVPVEVLREMGVGRVIAVNAIPTPDRLRYCQQAERELARQNASRGRKWFRKVLPLDKQLNYFARGNLFEILVRSVHGAQVRVAEAAGHRADLVLRPDTYDDRWLDVRNPGRFIAMGRAVAERNLEEIKALASGKSTNHEQQRAPEPVAAVA